MIDARLRAGLERIAAVAPLLVASDYDGVLSPIVGDPAAAFPDDAALAALVQLGQMPAPMPLRSPAAHWRRSAFW